MVIVLSMPFHPLVFIDYTIIANWPSDKKSRYASTSVFYSLLDVFPLKRAFSRENITVDLVIQAPYNELKDLLSEGQFPNAVRQKLVKSLRNSVDDILEADRVLLHIHAFNTDPVFYRIPVGVSAKIPIFTVDDKTKEMTVFLGFFLLQIALLSVGMDSKNFSTQREQAKTFVGFWSSLCELSEKSWQKWVHVHSERIILKSSNVPFNMENSDIPVYFYMIKVTLEPPCLILRTAFLGGVVDANRRRLLDLRLMEDGKETEALSVIRRPLERIMIRYRSIPKDLQTIVRVREDDTLEDPKLLILHNAISKYLECRRRIWNLPQLNAKNDRTYRPTAEYILSVLMQRRLEEGFRVAWAHGGIVGFCRQVSVVTR
ncbi:unnamed protein product [Angiostrongylus costaricensis]|uniref:Coiled-coil and C2 domain-containing protein 2A n=1 Tax=Angiostrongylus costaricensis TaxID=334426 RepID=A0A0R3PSL2_ANGCS|nr:unnamed protein product [Angiostrongylus costaricensis]